MPMRWIVPFDDLGLEPDDRVELEQRHGRRGVLEIDFVEDAGRQRVGVDLETDRERGQRVDGALDDFVEAKGVGPEALVAEGVEAEDLAPRDGIPGRDRIPARHAIGSSSSQAAGNPARSRVSVTHALRIESLLACELAVDNSVAGSL